MAVMEVAGYSIDDITKALGATAIGAYVLGYLVLSYHFARFGFNPVSAFRPRVLETGVCTLAFFAIPVLIGAAVSHLPSRGTHPYKLLLLRTLILTFLCEGLRSAWDILVELPLLSTRPSLHATWRGTALPMALTLAAFALFIAVVFWVWKNYDQRIMLCVLALTPFSVEAIYQVIGRDSQPQVYFWCLGVSFLTCLHLRSNGDAVSRSFVGRHLKRVTEVRAELKKLLAEVITPELHEALDGAGVESPDLESQLKLIERCIATDGELEATIKDLKSETSILRLKEFAYIQLPAFGLVWSLIALAVWTYWVFPQVPFRFGGGETVPITIFETHPAAPPHPIHVGMLDESDQGLFVLLPGLGKGAFIPKERIESIYFANDSDPLLKDLE